MWRDEAAFNMIESWTSQEWRQKNPHNGHLQDSHSRGVGWIGVHIRDFTRPLSTGSLQSSTAPLPWWTMALPTTLEQAFIYPKVLEESYAVGYPQLGKAQIIPQNVEMSPPKPFNNLLPMTMPVVTDQALG